MGSAQPPSRGTGPLRIGPHIAVCLGIGSHSSVCLKIHTGPRNSNFIQYSHGAWLPGAPQTLPGPSLTHACSLQHILSIFMQLYTWVNFKFIFTIIN
jgi:hypothetical protein